jgi:hypothetical protein
MMINLFKNLNIKIICLILISLKTKIECCEINDLLNKNKNPIVKKANSSEEECIAKKMQSLYEENKNKRNENLSDFYKKKIESLTAKQNKLEIQMYDLQDIKNFSNEDNFKKLIYFYKQNIELFLQIEQDFRDCLKFREKQISEIENDIKNIKLFYESVDLMQEIKYNFPINKLVLIKTTYSSAKSELEEYNSKNNQQYDKYESQIRNNFLTGKYIPRYEYKEILNRIPNIKKLREIFPNGVGKEYKQIIIEFFGEELLKKCGKKSFYDFFQNQFVKNIIDAL